MKNRSLRFNFIIFILILAMLALIGRVFQFTVVKGDYYSNSASKKVSREVSISAARGNIYDRNGKLLAGTKSSHVVKIYKDEFMRADKKDRNDCILKLIRFLEEDGVDYLSESYIGINKLTYKDPKSYNDSKTPEDLVVDAIINNNLTAELLKSTYRSSGEYPYTHAVVDNVLKQLEKKNIYLPVEVKKKGDLKIDYIKGKQFEGFKNAGKLNLHYYLTSDDKKKIKDKELSAFDLIVENIKGNRSVLYNLLSHPINREIAYKLLVSHKLDKTIKLEHLIFNDDLNFLIKKINLHANFPKITMESNAKDDFFEIVYNSSLEEFASGVYVDKELNMYIPAEKILTKLKELGVNPEIEYSINNDAKSVTYFYNKKDVKLGTEPALKRIISLGKKHKIFKDLILDDQLKYVAQEAIFNNGLYPNISINSWNYSYETNKKDVLERYKMEEGTSPEAAFKIIKEKNEIDVDNDIEANALISIINSVNLQGNYAYVPYKLAYGLSSSFVAKISESIPKLAGIEIESEPVRYYPYNTSAAHALGYVGKISQQYEIDRYITEKKYLPTDMIGKTGIEESYEYTLKGTDGKRLVKVDNRGNRTDILSQTEATPGNNVYLSIDIDVQRATERVLEKGLEAIRKGGVFESKWGNFRYGEAAIAAKSAAAVVMDVETGEVIALANYPSYDPNLFSTGITDSDWKSLSLEDKEDKLAPRPLLNQAIQTAVQPGSTFKPVSSMAALDMGLNPNTQINDTGYIDVGDTRFRCWIFGMFNQSHGYLNLYEALQVSCNYYFYCLALGENPRSNEKVPIQLTVKKIEDTVKKFGLDQKTGIEINVPQESSGIIPSTSVKLSATKSILSNYLKENLKNYLLEDSDKTDEEYGADIKVISSWLERGASMSRDDVYKGLDKLGYDPDKVVKGNRASLTDILKYDYLNQVEWRQADSLNVVIGQGQNAYTPIQMARMTAMLANKGKRLKATVIDRITNYDSSAIVYQNEAEYKKENFSDASFEAVKNGMHMSSQNGVSATIFNNFPVKIASKTGTAEVDGIDKSTGLKYDTYSWFIAYAPMDKPKYAISILLTQGGSGSNGAAIARDIIASALKLTPEKQYDEIQGSRGMEEE